MGGLRVKTQTNLCNNRKQNMVHKYNGVLPVWKRKETDTCYSIVEPLRFS